MAKTMVRGEQITDGTVSLTADVKDVLPIANGGTGNTSGSAVKLATARNINGVSFDGSADITAGFCDLTFVVQTGTRATGAGDLLVGFYVTRAFTASSITYQFGTADASSSTGVELRRNGSQVTSSNLSVSAANQADGTGTDSARTATINQAFSVGDRISVQTTSVGTTPGKQLIAIIRGRYT